MKYVYPCQFVTNFSATQNRALVISWSTSISCFIKSCFVTSYIVLRFYSLMIVVIHGYYLNSRAPYYLSVSLYQITFCNNTHKHNYYFCMLVNISPPSLTFHYYYMFTLLRNTNKMNCININRPKGEIVVFICLKSRMSS